MGSGVASAPSSTKGRIPRTRVVMERADEPVTNRSARSSAVGAAINSAQRDLSVLGEGEIGQARPYMAPGCCHGKRSVRAGRRSQTSSPETGANGSPAERSSTSHPGASSESGACTSLTARRVSAWRSWRSRRYRTVAGAEVDVPLRYRVTTATGVSMAKTLALRLAPRFSPPRSSTQISSACCWASMRSPTKPGPRSHEAAVMNETTAGRPGSCSKAFHSAQRQK